MVQRFLEAVQIYTMYIYLCLYFICPPLYFCFQAFLDCDSTRGTSSWVLQRLLQGSRDWNRNRNRDRSSRPTHLFFPPNEDYSLCIQNLFCKQSNAITNKLDFVPMFYTHPIGPFPTLLHWRPLGKSLWRASWWLKEYVTDIWAALHIDG